jgi:hypothetical protein
VTSPRHSETRGCVLCGRSPVEWHHVTGRLAPEAAYFDRSLVVPLCKRHHDREHELLRRRRLEFVPLGADLLGHRLARLLEFIGRCAESGRHFVVEPVTPWGDAVSGVYALLFEAARAATPSDIGMAG